jgi:KDO2-lipid IV(A) lauroyltransferase
MTLPLRLAQAANAVIVWALAVRTQDGWRFELEPWQQSDALAAMDPQKAVAAMNAALESWIAKAPEQYLWAYHRYKAPGGMAAADRPSKG